MNISVIIYNFLLTILLILFYPIVATKVKFEKVDRSYKFWIHCASLGEVKLALRLIQNIVEQMKVDVSNILLTTTTLTAKKVAQNVHKNTFLFPLDYYFISRNFIKTIRPKVLIILETELWLNYIYLVKKYGGKIFLLNGRISHNTFVFLKVFKFLFYPALEKIDYFLLREKIDFIRFKNLGVNQNKLIITGNMKYDDVELFGKNINKTQFGLKDDNFVVTFGSIRENEEKEIIKIINKFKTNDKIKFILAPRHLQLVKKIEDLLKKYEISYKLLTSQIGDYEYRCLIINTYGGLKKFYAVSDIVFVCGTILPYGGQNIIEPASLGKMVVFGPYISSFLEPATMLLYNNAAIQIKNISQFEKIIIECLNNKTLPVKYGEKAKTVVSSLQGATQKNINFIKKVLNYEVFNY